MLFFKKGPDDEPVRLEKKEPRMIQVPYWVISLGFWVLFLLVFLIICFHIQPRTYGYFWW